MTIYCIVFLMSTLISSISQVLLKKSAKKEYKNKISEYMNPIVIFAYGLFFASTLLTTVAYKYVPLSFGPILEATGYVYVAILGTVILKEKMTKKKVLANILIILGVVVYSL